MSGFVGDVEVPIADFTHLKTHCGFIALMPQWDFLDFIADHAKRFPRFHLKMKAEVTELIEADGRVLGVARQPRTGHSKFAPRSPSVPTEDTRRFASAPASRSKSLAPD